jgi:hypothetical protein
MDILTGTVANKIRSALYSLFSNLQETIHVALESLWGAVRIFAAMMTSIHCLALACSERSSKLYVLPGYIICEYFRKYAVISESKIIRSVWLYHMRTR